MGQVHELKWQQRLWFNYFKKSFKPYGHSIPNCPVLTLTGDVRRGLKGGQNPGLQD